jgi:hypothetical protein
MDIIEEQQRNPARLMHLGSKPIARHRESGAGREERRR